VIEEHVDHEVADQPVAEDAPGEKKTGPPRGGRGCAVEILETLIATLVIFLVIQNFVAQPFQVKGSSMERTFLESDYIIVDRLTPRWSSYSRGQVVVFHPPESEAIRGEPFIKRVIGVGGDTVEVRDGRVFVNGAALDEPYLFRDADGLAEPTIAREESRWVVPAGDIFVMGDHRQVSEDSRVFGPIPISTVIGRGVVRYWPLSELGIIATPTYQNVPAP
jgi:signal peptidase I